MGLNEDFAPPALDNSLPGVHLAFYLFHKGFYDNVQNIGHSLFDTSYSSITFVNLQEWMAQISPASSVTIPVPPFTGWPSLVDYHRGGIGVHDSGNYIQPGVLIFNIRNMTEEQILEHGRLASTLYWIMDQDVINRIFYDKICFIPPNWNVC